MIKRGPAVSVVVVALWLLLLVWLPGLNAAQTKTEALHVNKTFRTNMQNTKGLLGRFQHLGTISSYSTRKYNTLDSFSRMKYNENYLEKSHESTKHPPAHFTENNNKQYTLSPMNSKAQNIERTKRWLLLPRIALVLPLGRFSSLADEGCHDESMTNLQEKQITREGDCNCRKQCECKHGNSDNNQVLKQIQMANEYQTIPIITNIPASSLLQEINPSLAEKRRQKTDGFKNSGHGNKNQEGKPCAPTSMVNEVSRPKGNLGGNPKNNHQDTKETLYLNENTDNTINLDCIKKCKQIHKIINISDHDCHLQQSSKIENKESNERRVPNVRDYQVREETPEVKKCREYMSSATVQESKLSQFNDNWKPHCVSEHSLSPKYQNDIATTHKISPSIGKLGVSQPDQHPERKDAADLKAENRKGSCEQTVGMTRIPYTDTSSQKAQTYSNNPTQEVNTTPAGYHTESNQDIIDEAQHSLSTEIFQIINVENHHKTYLPPDPTTSKYPLVTEGETYEDQDMIGKSEPPFLNVSTTSILPTTADVNISLQVTYKNDNEDMTEEPRNQTLFPTVTNYSPVTEGDVYEETNQDIIGETEPPFFYASTTTVPQTTAKVNIPLQTKHENDNQEMAEIIRNQSPFPIVTKYPPVTEGDVYEETNQDIIGETDPPFLYASTTSVPQTTAKVSLSLKTNYTNYSQGIPSVSNVTKYPPVTEGDVYEETNQDIIGETEPPFFYASTTSVPQTTAKVSLSLKTNYTNYSQGIPSVSNVTKYPPVTEGDVYEETNQDIIGETEPPFFYASTTSVPQTTAKVSLSLKTNHTNYSQGIPSVSNVTKYPPVTEGDVYEETNQDIIGETEPPFFYASTTTVPQTTAKVSPSLKTNYTNYSQGIPSVSNVTKYPPVTEGDVYEETNQDIIGETEQPFFYASTTRVPQTTAKVSLSLKTNYTNYSQGIPSVSNVTKYPPVTEGDVYEETNQDIIGETEPPFYYTTTTRADANILLQTKHTNYNQEMTEKSQYLPPIYIVTRYTPVTSGEVYEETNQDIIGETEPPFIYTSTPNITQTTDDINVLLQKTHTNYNQELAKEAQNQLQSTTIRYPLVTDVWEEINQDIVRETETQSFYITTESIPHTTTDANIILQMAHQKYNQGKSNGVQSVPPILFPTQYYLPTDEDMYEKTNQDITRETEPPFLYDLSTKVPVPRTIDTENYNNDSHDLIQTTDSDSPNYRHPVNISESEVYEENNRYKFNGDFVDNNSQGMQANQTNGTQGPPATHNNIKTTHIIPTKVNDFNDVGVTTSCSETDNNPTDKVPLNQGHFETPSRSNITTANKATTVLPDTEIENDAQRELGQGQLVHKTGKNSSLESAELSIPSPGTETSECFKSGCSLEYEKSVQAIQDESIGQNNSQTAEPCIQDKNTQQCMLTSAESEKTSGQNLFMSKVNNSFVEEITSSNATSSANSLASNCPQQAYIKAKLKSLRNSIQKLIDCVIGGV